MSSYLNYKGYTGTVEYSEVDDCLFGKVVGIRSLILYEGNSLDELKKDFYEAVDDYLDLCAENGTEPEKPYKGSFNVRVSPEIHREAAICAARQGTSLNGFIADALEKAIQAAHAKAV